GRWKPAKGRTFRGPAARSGSRAPLPATPSTCIRCDWTATATRCCLWWTRSAAPATPATTAASTPTSCWSRSQTDPRELRRGRALPDDAGGDAELILLGVRHSDPSGSAEALYAFVDATSTECLQPADLGLDVVDHDVEVHAVLAGFGFGYSL